MLKLDSTRRCTDKPRRSFRSLTKVWSNKESLSPSGTTVSLSTHRVLGQVQSPLIGLGENLKPPKSLLGKDDAYGLGVPGAERGRGAGIRRKPLLPVMI